MLDGRTKLSIATLMIAAFMIGTDFTGALLLVTPIEKDFSADITTTQWVLNIYALFYGVFMVTGGRLGDMYGHRRLILFGIVIFFVASLGCLLAPSMGWLIGARAGQGVGAAILWPCILACGATSVEKERQGLAMGLILAGITGGNMIGPLIGGIVAWLGDWRLFFLVNAVLAVVSVALVLRFLKKEHPGKVDERIDVAGMATLGVALLALLYGLDVGSDWGWSSAELIGLLVVSAVLFAVFPFVETRVKDPMVPSSLMRNRAFMLVLSTSGFLIPSIYIALLYFPQYMQSTLGWSVLAASFGMLPFLVLSSAGSAVIGRFYTVFGPKRLLLTGYVLVALGAASVIVMQPSWGYVALLPPMLLIGAAATLCIGTAGTAAVSAVPPSRAGIASGLSFMVHLSAGAIGVACATAIMTADITGVAQGGMRDALAQGMSDAYWLAFVLAVIGIVVCALIDEEKLQAASD